MTFSTHTSTPNIAVFRPPAMLNTRMSLCTQSVYYFSFPPHHLHSEPSRFTNTIPCINRLSYELVPPPTNVFLCATSSQSSHTELSRGHGFTRSSDALVSSLPPEDGKQDTVVYGAGISVVFLGKGPRTESIQQKSLDCLVLYHSELNRERHFWLLVVDLT